MRVYDLGADGKLEPPKLKATNMVFQLISDNENRCAEFGTANDDGAGWAGGGGRGGGAGAPTWSRTGF